MKVRYSERIPAKGRVLITVGSQITEGNILDLSVPGCLIESSVSVKKGDSLQLKLFLPGLKSSFSVELATVRWTEGFRFGVEFLKMHPDDQRRLEEAAAPLRSKRASRTEGTRQRFSGPTAVNWHLDTHSLA